MSTDDDFRGSAPVMSSKELLLEVYHDMKIIRPAVEALMQADLVRRVGSLELDHATRDAAGGAPTTLVSRVTALEDKEEARTSASLERRRISDLSGRAIAAVVITSNFVLGLVVMFANLLQNAAENGRLLP